VRPRHKKTLNKAKKPTRISGQFCFENREFHGADVVGFS